MHPQGGSGDGGGKMDYMGILLINTAALGTDNRTIIFKLIIKLSGNQSIGSYSIQR